MGREQQIQQRLQDIQQLIETRTDMTAEELTALETEVQELLEDRAGLVNQQEQRKALLANIAGNTGGTEQRNLGSMAFANGTSGGEVETTTDPYDTVAYRNAFMEFTCRGTALPIEYRTANNCALTTTEDTEAVIPTTILNEIIKKAESYGNLFRGVRRMSIQGGVQVPIMTLMPEAKWISETEPSADQKLQAKEYVQFTYHGLEVKIARTLLVAVVTLAEFQRQFVRLASEAMIKAIDKAIIRGDGNGSMMGVINEPRILATNKITLTSAEFGSWNGWKTKVFAKMKKAYRNGIFIMAQGTFDGHIDGMVDANGSPIARMITGTTATEVYRFSGRTVEIVEDDVLPNYEDAQVGDVVAIFMRLEDYAVNTNMQMRVVHWRDENDNTIKNKCIMVLDGKVLDPHGIILICKGETVAATISQTNAQLSKKDKELRASLELKEKELLEKEKLLTEQAEALAEQQKALEEQMVTDDAKVK